MSKMRVLVAVAMVVSFVGFGWVFAQQGSGSSRLR